MKILDIPQAGKRGLNVSQGGRYGQVSRALVIPSNPRTAAQRQTRAALTANSRAWAGLTQAQRDAWTAAAKTVNSKPSVGQSGALTGGQLFSKVNLTLAITGAAAVNDPPAKPNVALALPAGFVITNPAGVTKLALTVPVAVGGSCIIRASAPVSQGRGVCNDLTVIGVCPAPVAGSSDITNLYTAKYGKPGAGTKVFVSATQQNGGYEDVPLQFWAIVPAAA